MSLKCSMKSAPAEMGLRMLIKCHQNYETPIRSDCLLSRGIRHHDGNIDSALRGEKIVEIFQIFFPSYFSHQLVMEPRKQNLDLKETRTSKMVDINVIDISKRKPLYFDV